mmetsp:Transcript_31658/g.96896  ORF Transcript_31658/g.96896 Transcript_31658/m.96896 type:complete len:440 (-) Transcript_31658:253-1572(-)
MNPTAGSASRQSPANALSATLSQLLSPPAAQEDDASLQRLLLATKRGLAFAAASAAAGGVAWLGTRAPAVATGALTDKRLAAGGAVLVLSLFLHNSRVGKATDETVDQTGTASSEVVSDEPDGSLSAQLDDLVDRGIVGHGSRSTVRLVRLAPTNGGGSSTARLFALKEVDTSQMGGDTMRTRAATEARLLLACDHGSVVKVFRVFERLHSHKTLMEWLPNGNFLEVLSLRGRLSETHAAFFAATTVCALQYLHERGIVHRDLRPEKLLIDARGYLKLTGLGFGKVISGRTYTAVGTLPYIAPEIILNEGHEFGVDWWALGVIVYEMLVGQSPFVDDGDDHSLCRRIISCDTEVTYPASMSARARDFVSRLLDSMPLSRLGCGGQGASELWGHPFLREYPRAALLARQVPAPFCDLTPSAHQGVVALNGESQFVSLGGG